MLFRSVVLLKGVCTADPHVILSLVTSFSTRPHCFWWLPSSVSSGRWIIEYTACSAILCLRLISAPPVLLGCETSVHIINPALRGHCMRLARWESIQLINFIIFGRLCIRMEFKRTYLSNRCLGPQLMAKPNKLTAFIPGLYPIASLLSYCNVSQLNWNIKRVFRSN